MLIESDPLRTVVNDQLGWDLWLEPGFSFVKQASKQIQSPLRLLTLEGSNLLKSLVMCD